MSDQWRRELDEALDFCDWEAAESLLRRSPEKTAAHLDRMKNDFEGLVES